MNDPISPIAIYVDQGVNFKKMRALQRKGVIKMMQAEGLEQQFAWAEKRGLAFTIGVSTIGGLDMIADDNVTAVRETMGIHEEDFKHVYSAYLNHCTYFVTNNPKDFIYNGRREQLEDILPSLRIRTLEELLIEINEV